MEMCETLDPESVLRATPRSFAIKVRDGSMVGAGIVPGDIVVGEFRAEARPGSIVVALVDGEPTLRRLVKQGGRLMLASETPRPSSLLPAAELVIQGVVHSVVHRLG